MTEDVTDWETLGVLIGVQEPKSRFHKIKQVYKHPKSQKEGLLKMWHDTHPLASWSLLQQALRMMGEMEAAKLVKKKFLQGNNYYFINTNQIFLLHFRP